MGDILVHRPARTPPVRPRPQPVHLADPPAASAGSGTSQWTYALFPLLGSGGILVFALVNRNPVYFLAGGVFVLGALGMGVAMFLQTRGRTREQSTDERRRYFAHLADVRARLRAAADDQRVAGEYQHPAPAALAALVDRPDRLWERRPEDPDFLLLRFGRGRVPGVAAPRVSEADPSSPRDPAGEAAARRLVQHLGPVPDVPVAVPLAAGTTAVVGEPGPARALVRAVLAQLAVLHAPDDVRVAVCCTDEHGRGAWDWVKWLPHARHPTVGGHDGTGLLLAEDPVALMRLLDAELDRRRRDAHGPASARTGRDADGPALVVVVDGPLPAPDPLAALDGLGVSVLRLVPDPDARPGRVAVTLRIDGTGDGTAGTGGGGVVVEVRRDRDGVPAAGLGELAAVDRVHGDALGLAETDVLARRLAPRRLSRRAGRGSSTQVGELPELLGIADVATLDPSRTWARDREQDLLRVPLGADADGATVHLDLKESALSGMGPHGLIVGATGSGKSELLRTIVVGLAVTHAPDELALVLVDYKGGATFAGTADLPHVAGSITDLEDDPENIGRFADALRSEMRRREQLLRDAGDLSGIREHRRLRLAGAPVAPMPHLLVVVDEFSELLVQEPDLIDLFVSVGRLGRSLGVHLLLATQRLEEGRLRGLDSHLSYRLALRTFSAAESRVVIGNADAFELPPVPGSAYLKVDTSVYRRLRVSTVSAPYVEPARGTALAVRPRARPFPGFATRGSGGAAPVALPALGLDLSDPERRSTLDVVVDRLRDAAARAHQVWLPPLPRRVPLAAVLPALRHDADRGLGVPAGRGHPGALRVPVGVVDRPEQQAQEPLVLDLAGPGGHVGVAGAPRTGRSTLLRTLATALALTHTPDEVHLYGLDLGGGTLAGLEALPHVGGVATRHRPELVRRLVAQLEVLLAEREQDADPETSGDAEAAAPGEGPPHVVLLVDDWAAVRAEFEDLEPRITALAARGQGRGLHVVVGTARWWDMRPALRDALGTKLELRLGDAADSVVDRALARRMPAVPGRVLVGGLRAQIAQPVLADDAGRPEEPAATARRVAAAWRGTPAPPIRLLPDLVTLPAVQREDTTDRRAGVAVGLRESDLRPARLDLVEARDPHLLVFGDSGSGKTAALRTTIAALCARYTPDELRVVVVDYRRTLLDAVPPAHLSVYCGSAPAAEGTLAAAATKMTARLPGPEITTEQLRRRDWWTGPRMLLVVDDHDLVATASGDPLAPMLELLPQGRDIGLHVVLARSSGGASAGALQPVLRRLRELGGPGLVLSGSREDGTLVHGVRPAPLPPGRARLVTRREGGELVQLAWTPEPGTS